MRGSHLQIVRAPGSYGVRTKYHFFSGTTSQGYAHVIKQIASRLCFQSIETVVAPRKGRHVDADFLRRPPEKKRINQTVAGLMDSQNGAHIGVGALAQMVDFERDANPVRQVSPAHHKVLRLQIYIDCQRLAAASAMFQCPKGEVHQRCTQQTVNRRKNRAGPLSRKHRVGINLRMDRIGDDKLQAGGCFNFLQISTHCDLDEFFIGGAAEARVYDVVVPESGNLFGLESLAQGALHVNDRQPQSHGVEHIGVGVAVLHAICRVGVHLVQIAANKNQKFGIVRLPGPWIIPERNQADLQFSRRPSHDFHDRLLEFEGLLEVMRLIGSKAEFGIRRRSS